VKEIQQLQTSTRKTDGMRTATYYFSGVTQAVLERHAREKQGRTLYWEDWRAAVTENPLILQQSGCCDLAVSKIRQWQTTEGPYS
jgi:hypothetical protein